MERLGHLFYQVRGGAGVDLGPAAWVFGRDNKRLVSTLWSGTDWSLALPSGVPPWPIKLEAMAVHLYDGTVQPGYALTGYWFEFGILQDQTHYIPFHAGYTDDAGRVRWSGSLHSDLGLVLAIGNNSIAGADNAILRVQAAYTQEVPL